LFLFFIVVITMGNADSKATEGGAATGQKPSQKAQSKRRATVEDNGVDETELQRHDKEESIRLRREEEEERRRQAEKAQLDELELQRDLEERQRQKRAEELEEQKRKQQEREERERQRQLEMEEIERQRQLEEERKIDAENRRKADAANLAKLREEEMAREAETKRLEEEAKKEAKAKAEANKQDEGDLDDLLAMATEEHATPKGYEPPPKMKMRVSAGWQQADKKFDNSRFRRANLGYKDASFTIPSPAPETRAAAAVAKPRRVNKINSKVFDDDDESMMSAILDGL